MIQTLLMKFCKKESIFLHHKRLKQVGKSRQLGSFCMAPHKSSSCLRLFTFPPYSRIITFSPLPLCSCRSHKYNNYEQATYIVSSNLYLFTFTRSQAFYEIPTHRGILVQRVFLKFIPLFLVLTFQIIYQYPGSKST